MSKSNKNILAKEFYKWNRLNVLFIILIVMGVFLGCQRLHPYRHTESMKAGLRTNVWYVDGKYKGKENGTNWVKPFNTISEAITAATPGDEIWVKQGIYSISSTINVNKAVQIYGGFFGTEMWKEMRDWKKYLTVIDGQKNSSVGSCLHISANALVDGFTITGGYSVTTDCTVAGGSGITIVNASPSFINNTIIGNTALHCRGGGIRNISASPLIANCIFSGNIAESGGAIANIWHSNPQIVNCTFTGNSSAYGGAIFNESSSPVITNCILWGDKSKSEIFNYSDSTPKVRYSNIYGGKSGTGNIDADPVFVNPADGDLHLQATSPCIDSGFKIAEILPIDINGKPRIADGDGDCIDKIDIGAHEYQLPDKDGDGVHDTCDNCPNVFNPDQADNDADQYLENFADGGDACDNCPTRYNREQTDTNGDGIGDVCEKLYSGRFFVNSNAMLPKDSVVHVCFKFHEPGHKSGDDLPYYIIPPDCANVMFFLKDETTNLKELDFFKAYKINPIDDKKSPGNPVKPKDNKEYCIKCNLSALYHPKELYVPTGTVRIFKGYAVYAWNIKDPEKGTKGSCSSDAECYDVFTGAIKTNVAHVHIYGGAVTVSIDIKPGVDPNIINTGFKGNIPVAIYGSRMVDVKKIDPMTVKLVSTNKRSRAKRRSRWPCSEDIIVTAIGYGSPYLY